jgi:hypothetical protein
MMRTRLLIDRLAVWWQGGIRVRVLKGGSQPEGVATGAVKGLSGDQALAMVLELSPRHPGVVHIIRKGATGWKVQVNGSLGDEDFGQRIRNILFADHM